MQSAIIVCFSNCLLISCAFAALEVDVFSTADGLASLISVICSNGNPGIDAEVVWYKNGAELMRHNASSADDYILKFYANASTAGLYHCSVKFNGTDQLSSYTLIKENKQTQNQICYQPKDQGTGVDSYSKKYYFNYVDGSCLPFVYLGSGGNDNRFSNRTTCEKKCPPDPIKGYSGALDIKDFTLPPPPTKKPTSDTKKELPPLGASVDSTPGTVNKAVSKIITTTTTTTVAPTTTTTTQVPTTTAIDCTTQQFTEYKFCGFCDRTCEHATDTSLYCPPTCIEGCFCIHGYARNAAGDCVQVAQCPTKKTCTDVNAKSYDCAPVCHISCADVQLNRPCVKKCKSGCFCNAGFFYSNGTCVKQADCPKITIPSSGKMCNATPILEKTCSKSEKFYYYDVTTESCVTTTGCTNSPNKFSDEKSCKTACGESCADGGHMVNCTGEGDPCKDAYKCTKVTDSRCVSDRCIGCRAYKYVDSKNRPISPAKCGYPSQQSLCSDVHCGHCRTCVVLGTKATCGPDAVSRYCRDPCSPSPCKACETCTKKNVYCANDPCDDHTCKAGPNC